MTAVFQTRLERLLAELERLEITVCATSRTTLSARPERAVTQDVLDELRYFKPRFLRVLRDASRAPVFACICCGTELVLTPKTRCQWCAAMAGTILGRFCRIDPNSHWESLLLEKIERQKSSQLSQLSQVDKNDTGSSHNSKNAK